MVISDEFDNNPCLRFKKNNNNNNEKKQKFGETGKEKQERVRMSISELKKKKSIRLLVPLVVDEDMEMIRKYMTYVPENS